MRVGTRPRRELGQLLRVEIIVGAGVQDVDWIDALLKQRNRQLAGKMAAPSGLYLCQVDYPMGFEIPKGTFPSQLLG